MRLGLALAVFLVVSGSALANGGPPEEGIGRNMCSVWHGWAGATAKQLNNRPTYLVATNCTGRDRATLARDITPFGAPRAKPLPRAVITGR